MSHEHRLYATRATLSAGIKEEGPPLYCHRAEKGKDYHHMIGNGELYISEGDHNYCLNCGLELHLLSTDRPTLEHMNRIPDQD